MNIKPFPKKEIIDLKDVLVTRGDNVTHGDLIIVMCDEKDFPNNFSDLPECTNGVLALGEFTGHAHKLEYDASTDLGVIIGEPKPLKERVIARQVSPTEMYMHVIEPVLLKHQEHKWFRIHPGCYEIGPQIERNPYDEQIRALRD